MLTPIVDATVLFTLKVSQTTLVYLRRKTERSKCDLDDNWDTVGGMGRIERRRVETSSAKDVEGCNSCPEHPIDSGNKILAHTPSHTFSKQVKRAKDGMAEKGAVSTSTALC